MPNLWNHAETAPSDDAQEETPLFHTQSSRSRSFSESGAKSLIDVEGFPSCRMSMPYLYTHLITDYPLWSLTHATIYAITHQGFCNPCRDVLHARYHAVFDVSSIIRPCLTLYLAICNPCNKGEASSCHRDISLCSTWPCILSSITLIYLLSSPYCM